MKTSLLVFVLNIAVTGGTQVIKGSGQISLQFTVVGAAATVKAVISNIERSGIAMRTILCGVDIHLLEASYIRISTQARGNDEAAVGSVIFLPSLS